MKPCFVAGTGAARVALALLAGIAALAPGILGVHAAQAVCCPFYCNGCYLQTTAQWNVVVMDRSAGVVRLVPNVAFVGPAPDFVLVVPTPSIPVFAEVPNAIWSEADRITAPARSQRPSTTACNHDNVEPLQADPDDGGVTVHVDQTVGRFQATVVSSDDPAALVTWLTEHAFSVTPEDGAHFVPYIQRHWYFTLMRLDPNDPLNRMPPEGWNADVNPVEIAYSAADFEIALPIVAIHRKSYLPMRFYVIDDHRTTLAEFTTRYANHVDAGELAAMQTQDPTFARYVAEGRWITRLERTFDADDLMDQSVFLQRAPHDDEYIELPRRFGAALPIEWLLFAAAWWSSRRRLTRQS
jgi:hypothetical protein